MADNQIQPRLSIVGHLPCTSEEKSYANHNPCQDFRELLWLFHRFRDRDDQTDTLKSENGRSVRVDQSGSPYSERCKFHVPNQKREAFAVKLHDSRSEAIMADGDGLQAKYVDDTDEDESICY